MSEKRDDDQVIRRSLVEFAGHSHLRHPAVHVDDGLVPFKLGQAERARPGDNSHVVSARAGQLKGEGAADLPSAENGDPKGRSWSCHRAS